MTETKTIMQPYTRDISQIVITCHAEDNYYGFTVIGMGDGQTLERVGNLGLSAVLTLVTHWASNRMKPVGKL